MARGARIRYLNILIKANFLLRHDLAVNCVALDSCSLDADISKLYLKGKGKILQHSFIHIPPLLIKVKVKAQGQL